MALILPTHDAARLRRVAAGRTVMIVQRVDARNMLVTHRKVRKGMVRNDQPDGVDIVVELATINELM